jgi:hypothetical protein
MVAQTFQNYVSALKWWVKYENPNYSKVPRVWSKNLDAPLQDFVKSYKREIKSIEGSGIMKQSKEGRSEALFASRLRDNSTSVYVYGRRDGAKEKIHKTTK